MISSEKAWERIEQQLQPVGTESITRDQALGRVVATPIIATTDAPSDDISAMDGLALSPDFPPQHKQAIDLRIAAGDPPGARLAPGGAARIMTGAPIPTGADRVVPIEETEVTSSTKGDLYSVAVLPAPGRHIRRRGELVRSGDSLFLAGKLVTAGTIPLLASQGISRLNVFRQPSVAFLTTGTELVAPELVPGPGQIRDSHSSFFAAALRDLGIEGSFLGIAPDDPKRIQELITRGLQHDVLIISGGVSMGELDHVETTLRELGCTVLFDAVAIQPGKPMVAAHHDRGWVFALPGNPASAMVCFWLFVRPALRRLAGYQDRFWRGALPARLKSPAPAGKARELFLPAVVFAQGREILVEPVLPVGSHDLGAYSQGTALLRIAPFAPPAAAGDACEILPLADWRCGR